MPAPSHPSTIHEVLARLAPRPRAILLARLTEGLSSGACAERFGIPQASLAVHVLRATGEYLAASGSPYPLPAEPDAERLLADELSALLDALPDPDTTNPLARALLPIRAQAAAVRQHLEQAEQAALSSPAYRREIWARRFFALIIVALTAYFYLTRDTTPRLVPRPRAPATTDAGR